MHLAQNISHIPISDMVPKLKPCNPGIQGKGFETPGSSGIHGNYKASKNPSSASEEGERERDVQCRIHTINICIYIYIYINIYIDIYIYMQTN